MPGTNDAQSRGAAAAGGSGCVLFLVDESKAMDARVAGGTKSKAQSIATALNSLLNQLTAGPAVDVAVVGYRAAGPRDVDVGSRWGGALAGRALVATGELAGAPLTVETRVRKVPGSGGVGVAREESVQFPVWYVPRLGEPASRTAAFEHCRAMLSEWTSAAGSASKPPMVVSFLGDVDPQETPEGVGRAIHRMETPGGPPLVLHVHLSTSDRVPAIVYPSSDAHLAPGPLRLLFEASSILPDELRRSLAEAQVNANTGARGLIYHARMVDLIRFLSLVKAYARYQPPPTAAPVPPVAPPAEPPAAAESFSTDAAGDAGAPVDTPMQEEPITMAPTGEVTVTGIPSAPADGTEGWAPESLTVQMPAPDAPTAQFSSADFGAPVGAAEGVSRADACASAESPPATFAAEDLQKPPAPPPAQDGPTPASAECAASATAPRALVVLLLDRSASVPTGQGGRTVWHRLQEQANEILAQLSKHAGGRIDCAALSHGTDASGRPEVAPAFGGALAGRPFVSDIELGAGVLRVEEVTEQVSNGIGGLVSVSRRKPIFVDLEPIAAAAAAPAFAAVKGLLAEWRERHAAGCVAAVVLHLTRGRFEPDEIGRAVGQLGEAGPLTLYHLVSTESPHPSVAYPAEPTKIREPALVRLWELTSPLLGGQLLARRKPVLTPESRGIVINGRFDLLLDGIQEALAAHTS